MLHIHKLICQGKVKSTKFKSYSNQLPRKVYKTACAFLNRHGGTILLGVQDDGVLWMLSSLMGNPGCVSMCRKARRCTAAMGASTTAMKMAISILPITLHLWRISTCEHWRRSAKTRYTRGFMSEIFVRN